jgi:hypothetical protein
MAAFVNEFTVKGKAKLKFGLKIPLRALLISFVLPFLKSTEILY